MDHSRVDIRSSGISCGVMELSRIADDTSAVVYAVATRLYHPSRGEPAAFFVFSDIDDGSHTSSKRLIQSIIDLGLGTITKSQTLDNPRTGNPIKVYVWEINHMTFKSWYAKTRSKRLARRVGT